MWRFGSASERVCAVIAKTFVAEPSHAVSSFSDFSEKLTATRGIGYLAVQHIVTNKCLTYAFGARSIKGP